MKFKVGDKVKYTNESLGYEADVPVGAEGVVVALSSYPHVVQVKFDGKVYNMLVSELAYE